MRVIDLLSPAGDKTGSIGLPPDIFEAKVSIPLIHQVVVAQLAASRQGTHKSKSRGEVRGGGRKPHRQKGTGRARQGSVRAPQFVGGGVVHGPKPRDYSQRTPKKMKAAALRGALTDRARHDRVHVVTEIVEGPKPSTKAARILLSRITERKNLLLVAERNEEAAWLSARNLPQVSILESGQLNTYDVLLSDDVVFTQAAFENFIQRAELPDIPESPQWLSSESERRYNELARQAPRRKRAAFWSIRISEEAQVWAEGRGIDPASEHLAMGHLDPRYDEVPSRTFGVILYRYVQDLPPGLGKVIGHLDIDKRTFKIVQRNVIANPALQVDPPPGGMVACWACSTRTQSEGWLTARHAVNLAGNVHFSELGVDRGNGAVIQAGMGDIDAALVATDNPPTPPHNHKLPVAPIPLLFNHTFNFTDQNGQSIGGVIEDVETTFPVLLDPKYAIRIRLSVAGEHGDSGALIRILETGEAAGLYIEDYKANARWGNPETMGGVGLAAEQIEAIMGIELRDDEQPKPRP